MENEEKIVKSTQKILNKLISEEIVATNIYSGSVSSVKPDQVRFIEKKFREIAADEMGDHWASLVKFAMENGFDVPFKPRDIEKFASKKLVSKLNNLKTRQDALYYIQVGIESELEAIKSFEEAMSEQYMFELQPLLLRCYYDEVQHLEDLQLLLDCTAIGVEVK